MLKTLLLASIVAGDARVAVLRPSVQVVGGLLQRLVAEVDVVLALAPVGPVVAREAARLSAEDGRSLWRRRVGRRGQGRGR